MTYRPARFNYFKGKSSPRELAGKIVRGCRKVQIDPGILYVRSEVQ